MKERLVAVSDYISSECNYVTPELTVHDSVLFEIPKDQMNRDVIDGIGRCLESPRILPKLSVPIRVDIGTSELDWADCDSDTFKVER
jgi:DNA polymerase I-like protein with 3'-5' exonuclease and polymerase domains